MLMPIILQSGVSAKLIMAPWPHVFVLQSKMSGNQGNKYVSRISRLNITPRITPMLKGEPSDMLLLGRHSSDELVEYHSLLERHPLDIYPILPKNSGRGCE